MCCQEMGDYGDEALEDKRTKSGEHSDDACEDEYERLVGDVSLPPS